MPWRDQEIVLGARDHVDNGIANADNVGAERCSWGLDRVNRSGMARTIAVESKEAIAGLAMRQSVE